MTPVRESLRYMTPCISKPELKLLYDSKSHILNDSYMTPFAPGHAPVTPDMTPLDSESSESFVTPLAERLLESRSH